MSTAISTDHVAANGRTYCVRKWKRGKGCVTVCISLSLDDIVALDAAADAAGMSRSEFIREAVKRLVGGDEK